jgi:hypothetical protein
MTGGRQQYMRRRTFMRRHFSCDPGGCGAKPGEPCRAYVQKPGKTTGSVLSDVHSARWRKFGAWARGELPLEDAQSSGRPENQEQETADDQ